MKKSIRTALAFLAVAGATGAVSAAEQPRRADRAMRFERADADRSGDVTYEEFAAVIGRRVKAADADGDGRITVAEVAGEIGRDRAERRARRLVKRFDTDGDGAVTHAEIETHQKAIFARLDDNEDGRISRNEMPRRFGAK